jgi:EAL domain-containing protein (putative c-di-GMP-specific phosphodiesterase class I)
VKIDPRIISRSVSSDSARHLLQGMLALADVLSIDVIAEGVETQEQYDQLKRMGCRHMQGYYFGVPLAPEQIPKLINMKEELYET